MIEVHLAKMKSTGNAIPNKKKILEYMKNGKHPMVAAMYYNDHETGKPAIEAYYLNDGKYIWSSETTYHFEKYNYPLPDDFISHVLKQVS